VARRTGAQRDAYRVDPSGRAGPGVNVGRTVRGSACDADGDGDGAAGPEREPSAPVTRPAASAPIAHARSAARLTR
jgi:hypothetical protein